jgi:hypothetical protein
MLLAWQVHLHTHHLVSNRGRPVSTAHVYYPGWHTVGPVLSWIIVRYYSHGRADDITYQSANDHVSPSNTSRVCAGDDRDVPRPPHWPQTGTRTGVAVGDAALLLADVVDVDSSTGPVLPCASTEPTSASEARAMMCMVRSVAVCLACSTTKG